MTFKKIQLRNPHSYFGKVLKISVAEKTTAKGIKSNDVCLLLSADLLAEIKIFKKLNRYNFVEFLYNDDTKEFCLKDAKKTGNARVSPALHTKFRINIGKLLVSLNLDKKSEFGTFELSFKIVDKSILFSLAGIFD